MNHPKIMIHEFYGCARATRVAEAVSGIFTALPPFRQDYFKDPVDIFLEEGRFLGRIRGLVQTAPNEYLLLVSRDTKEGIGYPSAWLVRSWTQYSPPTRRDLSIMHHHTWTTDAPRLDQTPKELLS